MFGIGMTELMVILVIGLLVLGPKRLPELARSLGRGLAEFRRASSDMRREFLDVAEEARIERPEDTEAGEREGTRENSGAPGADASSDHDAPESARVEGPDEREPRGG